MLSFPFSNRSQIHFFLFLESRNLYCFPNSRSVTLKEGDTVNMKTFDQSEHDTRIWYHGTAASKTCLQAPSSLLHPQAAAGLASLGDIFPTSARFLSFSPLRRLVPGYFSWWCIDVGRSCFLSVVLFLLILISMSGTSEDLTYLMRRLANIKMSSQVMHKKMLCLFAWDN